MRQKSNELEKLIYSFNEKEIDFYLNSIKSVRSNYEKFFKK
jgi:hypothetical protein